MARREPARSHPPEETVVTVDDAIRLGQLLKLAGVVDSGAEARTLLADGEVEVDGEVDTRRGRQVEVGSVVRVALPTGDRVLRVAAGGPAPADRPQRTM